MLRKFPAHADEDERLLIFSAESIEKIGNVCQWKNYLNFKLLDSLSN